MSASANDVSSLKGAPPHQFDHDMVEPEMAKREAVVKAISTLVTDLVLSNDNVPRKGRLEIDYEVVREGAHDQRVVASGLFGPLFRSTALVRRI